MNYAQLCTCVTMSNMVALPISDHPIRWRVPVRPADLSDIGEGGQLVVVPGGAVAAGTRADAAVLFDPVETDRRSASGLNAVQSLALLDVLLGLPLGVGVRQSDLSEREARILREAQPGCLASAAGTLTRTVRVPATVAAAMVHGTRWRAAMRRSAAFSAFTQRIVVLPREPKPTEILEAQLVGVGIWEEDAQGAWREHLAPEVFVPRYVKPAGWRFAENAFGTGVGAGLVPGVAVRACC